MDKATTVDLQLSQPPAILIGAARSFPAANSEKKKEENDVQKQIAPIVLFRNYLLGYISTSINELLLWIKLIQNRHDTMSPKEENLDVL